MSDWQFETGNPSQPDGIKVDYEAMADSKIEY